MITPVYVTPAAGPTPDIYGAVYDYVLAYGLPSLAPENIYRGWQNRSALPANSNEYAVISVFESSRRGTNVEILLNTGAEEDEPEIYQSRAYFEVRVQVDLLSDSDLGRQRAITLVTAARSSLGVNFFKPYGITCQYAEPIREIPQIDEANQFVRRYATSLRLAYWGGVDVGSAWVAIGHDGKGIIINLGGGRTDPHPTKE